MNIRPLCNPRYYRYAFALFLGVASAQLVVAKDFVKLQGEIQSSKQNIDALEDAFGRYDFQLVEPLEQLARIQIEANRFTDADSTLERAIQIARFSDGLNSSLQYPLLQLSIQNSQSRRDWSAAEERLDRFSLLVANRFEGESAEQLSLLKWISDTHLQCALAAGNENRVIHITKATMLNEYAVQLAQLNAQSARALYAELLHSLSHKYYIETRGILAGGEQGHALRVLQNGSGHVETKVGALERRYLAGLEKLLMLRDLAAHSADSRLEAIAMAEIYIADWNLMFDAVKDIDQAYGDAMNKLVEAGISEAKVQQFFSVPAVLPRTDFTLSFEVAAANLRSSDADISATLSKDRQEGALSLAGGYDYLPGFVIESDPGLPNNLHEESSLRLSLEINPWQKSRNWYRGFSQKSSVTPSSIEIHDAASISKDSRKTALSHVKKIMFRPAFREGVSVPATIAVQYRYRDEDAEPNRNERRDLNALTGG